MNEFCLLILRGWFNFVYVYFHIKYCILHKKSPPTSRCPLFIDNSEFQPNQVQESKSFHINCFVKILLFEDIQKYFVVSYFDFDKLAC